MQARSLRVGVTIGKRLDGVLEICRLACQWRWKGALDFLSFRAPMAIAVIGGLITSTLLSLIVVPAAFTVLDDLGEWAKRKRAPAQPL